MQSTFTQTFFAHESIEQRIFLMSKNSELIPIKMLPNFIPLAYQTIRNQIHKKTFCLRIKKINNRNYVRARDLIQLLKSDFCFQKKVGRKKDCERALLNKKAKNLSICIPLRHSKQRRKLNQKISFSHFAKIGMVDHKKEKTMSY